jgi:hypothetical protein
MQLMDMYPELKYPLWQRETIINHPNGYTSVYGHLKSANGAIEQFIKRPTIKSSPLKLKCF